MKSTNKLSCLLKENKRKRKPGSLHECVMNKIESNKPINDELLKQFLGRKSCELDKPSPATKSCMPAWIYKRSHAKRVVVPVDEQEKRPTKMSCFPRVTETPKQPMESPTYDDSISEYADHRKLARSPVACVKQVMYRQKSRDTQNATDRARTVPSQSVVGRHIRQGMEQVRFGHVRFVNIPNLAEERLLSFLDFLDVDTDLQSVQSFDSFDTSALSSVSYCYTETSSFK